MMFNNWFKSQSHCRFYNSANFFRQFSIHLWSCLYRKMLATGKLIPSIQITFIFYIYRKRLKIPCNHSCDCLCDSYMVLACPTIEILCMHGFHQFLSCFLLLVIVFMIAHVPQPPSLLCIYLYDVAPSVYEGSLFCMIFEYYLLLDNLFLQVVQTAFKLSSLHTSKYFQIGLLFVSQSTTLNHHVYQVPN